MLFLFIIKFTKVFWHNSSSFIIFSIVCFFSSSVTSVISNGVANFAQALWIVLVFMYTG